MERVFKEELVSLVLPIYNIPDKFLNECLNSIINQTYKNIEIILIDDGSTNNSLEICNSYSKYDNRIKVVHQENSGVSIARNNGLKMSHGKYVCFIDPDDYIKPTYVEKLVNTIELNNSDCAICNCLVSYSKQIRKNSFLKLLIPDGESILLDKNEINELQKQLLGKKICKYYPPEVSAGVPWGKIFKREFLINNNLFFIPKMVRMQDNIFCLYMYEKTNKISYLNEYLYVYRKELGSACFKFSLKIIEYFEKYYEETILFLDKYNKDEKLYKAFYMKELTSFNSYFSQMFFNKNYNKKYKKIKYEINELLKKNIYANAIKNIDYNLLTFTEKIFVYLLKHKHYRILKILIRIRNLKKM